MDVRDSLKIPSIQLCCGETLKDCLFFPSTFFPFSMSDQKYLLTPVQIFHSFRGGSCCLPAAKSQNELLDSVKIKDALASFETFPPGFCSRRYSFFKRDPQGDDGLNGKLRRLLFFFFSLGFKMLVRKGRMKLSFKKHTPSKRNPYQKMLQYFIALYLQLTIA